LSTAATPSPLRVDNSSGLCSNRPVTQSAYIALGSNMGDRELHLLRAIGEIGKLSGTRITALSSFYDSDPEGPPQQNFLNAVIRLETDLDPVQLLSEFKRIEVEVFQRKRDIHWGPRRMDLDILYYGSQLIASPELTIPHPRLHERRFVLAPLTEIAADHIHPGLGRTSRELLALLPPGQRVEKVEDHTC